MASQLAITPLALTQVYVTGVSASTDIGEYRSAAKLRLVAASLEGVGPTVQVTVETSPDEVSWRTVGTFTERAGAGSEEVAVVGLDRYIRIAYALSGTAAKLQVTGVARQLYAVQDDVEALSLGDALSGADTEKLARALINASDTAAGYLSNVYSLPLVSWGDDLTGHTAALAAFRYMMQVGYAPEGTDELIRTIYEDAIRWFEKVSSGKVRPGGIVDATPAVEEGGVYVYTSSKRGW